MPQLISFLNGAPLASLMLIVAVGYSLGRVTWKGLSAGPAAGTLFLALGLGQLGLTLEGLYGDSTPPITLGTLGFTLFIYSIGFEAGPRFFSSLRRGDGLRYVAIGSLVNVVAVAVAILMGRLLHLNAAATAGMLAGALTSAPTYAAASELLQDDSLLSVSFALTYPFGLVGLVVLLQVMPRITKQSLSRGAATDVEVEDGGSERRRVAAEEVTRAFRVSRDDVIESSLKDLDLTHRTGCVISRMLRGGELVMPQADTVLERGDQVLATGRIDELEVFAGLVGPEIDDADLQRALPPPRRVRVDSPSVLAKSLAELELVSRYRCIITRIERQQLAIEPTPEVELERGDVVFVAGERDNIREAAAYLGRFEAPADETNIAIYAGGIFLGLLLGKVQLAALGLPFSLGSAGGLLLVGLILGRLRYIGHLNAQVPRSARQLVRDLGILLFVAESGVRAGSSLLQGMSSILWQTVLGGVAVTLVPVLVSLFVARRVLGLKPVHAWGSICGGMTSSAALHAVRRAADSSEPAISYAAAYAVASVLVTIAGQVVVYLMPG